MDWTFDNFKVHLQDLPAQVQEKALELAEKIQDKKGISQDEAIQEAIVQAQEWFYDSEG